MTTIIFDNVQSDNNKLEHPHDDFDHHHYTHLYDFFLFTQYHNKSHWMKRLDQVIWKNTLSTVDADATTPSFY
ncbi:hypothetical protein BC941DRAFT_432451 [Chlamydoabsidia padenii]|nr:hypothetical protein BC941DRAFT_432451 [Chlamydoabsidia padenii]